MEVKGVAVGVTGRFVEKRFGPEAHTRWLAQLSPESRAILTAPILSTSWYPMVAALVDPTHKLCELFFDGELRGAWELGRFSADQSLRGIYKLFVRMHQPMWTIQKSQEIFSLYYRPAQSSAEQRGPTEATITYRYSDFTDPLGIVERRVAGWVERGVEIAGVEEPHIEIAQSSTQGHPGFQLLVRWS